LPNLTFDKLDERGPGLEEGFKPGAIGSILFPDSNLSGLQNAACLFQPIDFDQGIDRNVVAWMTRQFADAYCRRLTQLSQKASGRCLGIPFGPISPQFAQDVQLGVADVPFVFYKQGDGSQLEVSRPIFLKTRITSKQLRGFDLRIFGKVPEIQYETVIGGINGVVKTATRDSVACYVLYSPDHKFI
jgi:hypothetical protein